MGKESAILLAKMGADVVILCRSKERAEAAIRDIKLESGSNKISSVQLDLASLKSVKACSDTLKKSLNKIDVLMNNAGVMAIPTRLQTEDGFETQFGKIRQT